MASQYSYEALDPSKTSIRLLRVEQPSGRRGIRCTLRKETVESAGYVALSYMWHPDNNNERHAIDLNGRSFQVTKSLWSFLNVAQHKFPYTNFWIDAICIDQDNVREQNHQVAHMHEIYSSASSVLIWLGEGDSDTQAFFDFVNNGSWTTDFLSRGQRILDPARHGPEPDEDLVLREGVRKMIRSPFWGRSWIVQELLLAKRIEIMMGSHCIDWGSFFGAMDIQEHAGSLESRAGGERMSHVRLFRDNPDGMTAPKDLAGLISYFSRRECSDPRDRVYSLLGIANERNNFEVDYNSTLRQVAEYTLGRINFENFLFAPSVVTSLGIPLSKVSTRLSPSFLNKKFTEDQTAKCVGIRAVEKDSAETLFAVPKECTLPTAGSPLPRPPSFSYKKFLGHQTAKYADIRAVEKGSAETVAGVPEEWKLPSFDGPLTLSRCLCRRCSSKAGVLVPQDGDIVAELPRSGLMVLCRPTAGRNSFNCVGGIGQDRMAHPWDQRYLCFALRDDLGDLCAAPIKPDHSADSGGVRMLEWRLSWKTVFAISEHAHLGAVPGLVVLEGPEPHNTWNHGFQDKE